MSRPPRLIAAIALAVITALSPHFGPPLVHYNAMTWIFYLVSPLLFVVLAIGVYVSTNRNRWSLLLWLLAPICFWYPGQLLLMLLIWTLRGGMV